MNTDALCPGCAAEHDRRYRPGSPTDQPAITSPEAAAELLMPMLARADREHCLTLNLDTKHRLIATTTVSIGSIDHTFMSPREVYRDALLHNAAAVILAHNHPSGMAEPSRADESLTQRLREALALVDIRLLDHFVVGDGPPVSMASRGML
jgi:DNA repair protein RadC